MNAALGYTSVSSTTILSSMSGQSSFFAVSGVRLMYSMPGFFTLGVGACVGVDEITPAKLGSVVLRFAATLPSTKYRAKWYLLQCDWCHRRVQVGP